MLLLVSISFINIYTLSPIISAILTFLDGFMAKMFRETV